jgi:hypothetical protein
VLPAAAGTLANPPLFACYISLPSANDFLWVSFLGTFMAPNCLLTQNITTLRVDIINAPANVPVAIVVVY